jgi:hypothetical protein
MIQELLRWTGNPAPESLTEKEPTNGSIGEMGTRYWKEMKCEPTTGITDGMGICFRNRRDGSVEEGSACDEGCIR